MKLEIIKCDICKVLLDYDTEGLGLNTEKWLCIVNLYNDEANSHICNTCYALIGKHYVEKFGFDKVHRTSTCQL